MRFFPALWGSVLLLAAACGNDAGPDSGADSQSDAGIGGHAPVGGAAGTGGEWAGGAGGAAGLGGAGAAGAPANGGAAGEAANGGSAGNPAGGSAGTSTAGAAGEAGSGQSGQAGSAGAAGAGCNCNPLEQCFNNALCVAKQVPMPGGYSIDATEVTAAQYAKWRGTQPSTSAMPPTCTSWKPDFSKGVGSGSQPVTFVDWCDAYAYCKSVGKRLCGKRGGGPNEFTAWADAAQSQWFDACSAGGANAYPYGGSYDSQQCNGAEQGAGKVTDVASLAGCQSSAAGYAGVWDLSGNVLEWEDSCFGADGKGDTCRVRGGSFQSGSDNLRCDFGAGWYGAYRDHTYSYLGFRCCSAP